MMKRLLAVLAVAVLFLAGCGDDKKAETTDDTQKPAATTTEPEETTTEAPEGLALDEWVEQADAICADTSDAADELGEPEDEEELFVMLPDALELIDDQISQIEELGAPDEQSDDIETLLELMSEQRDLIADSIDEVEGGADPVDAAEALFSDGEDIETELDELATDLGMEDCATGSSDTPDTTDPTTPDTGGTGEPFTYGDDADLDALWDACDGGDGAACDELYFGSPVDSEYEEFGNTCGLRFDLDNVPLSCEDEIGTGGTGGTEDAFTYGDDAALDQLWDACEGGNGTACDELFWGSPVDSEYEAFGNTCGDLFTDDEAPASCEEEIGGEKIITDDDIGVDGSSYGDDPKLDTLYDACADGDMTACDDLFWDSPIDSEYENFGQTCGDLFTEADAPFSCAEGE